MRSFILNIGLVFLTSYLANAQSNPKITHVDTRSGLHSNKVYFSMMDSKEYMWFCTDFGLSRYDGIKFKNFLPNLQDSFALGNSRIVGIHERSNGHFWVLGNFCLYNFNPETEQFTPTNLLVNADDGMFEFFNFYADNDTILWAGGKGGLFSYNAIQNSFENFSVHRNIKNTREQFDYNNVTAIGKDESKDALWIGTKTRKLYSFDIKSSSLNFIKKFPKTINSIKENDNNLWLATYGAGVFKYDLKTSKSQQFASNQFSMSVSDIVLTNNSVILGTLKSGLLEFEDEDIGTLKKIYSLNQFSDSYFIKNLFKDKYDRIWASTWDGVINYDQRKNYVPSFKAPYKTKKEDENFNVIDIEIINSNEFLLLTDEKGGYYKFKPDEKMYTNIDAESDLPLLLNCAHKGNNGTIYLARNEIFIYDTLNNRIVKHPKSNLKETIGNVNINDIYYGKNNDLYLATSHSGIVQFNEKTGETTHIMSDSINTYQIDNRSIVKNLFEDSQGMLNITTDGYGTYRYDLNKKKFASRFVNVGKELGQNNNLFEHFFEYKPKQHLVRLNIGLYLADDEGAIIRELKNHKNQSIGSIITAKQLSDGSIAALTIEGLYIFDRDLNVDYYGQKNGIRNLAGWSTELKVLENDFIFIGKKNSFFNLFRLSDLPKNKLAPPMVLTDIEFVGDPVIFDKKVDYLNIIELEHQQNFFTVSYQALNYTNPEDNQYKYQLVGLHDEWVDNGNNTSATFTNLNPGNYTFKVIGSNNDGVWNVEGRSLDIIINPPWYQTWWAYLIYVILAFGSIFLYINYRRKKWVLENQLISEQREAERLKELDETKNKIYTNITHELLTPLTVIKGLNARNGGSDIIKAKIDDNSSELLNLINQMLALSKMESGHVEYEPVLLDIIPFLNYLVESYSSAAQQKSISLNFYSEIKHLEMDVDHEKLKTTVGNLIKNAIKYTPTYGKIMVIAKIESEGQFQIIVQDNGIGVSEKQIEHIFDRFYQIDKKSEGGAGIGLSIVKEYSELMKGAVSVESTLKKGSSFTLSLPIQKTAKTTLQLHELQQTRPTIEYNEVEIEENTDWTSSENQTILIIEDNYDVAFYIKEILKKDYNCIHKINGKEGLKAAMEIIPDVIISDVMMPQMDGIAMSQLLKNDIQTSHIPIILLTAKTRQDDMLAGLKAGADAYLTKPFNEQELLLRIEGILESRQKMQTYYTQHQTIPQSTSKEHAFVQQVKEVINKNMANENLSINDICRAVNLERSQVFRKLKALTGQSASVMIKELRLQKAKELLLEDKKNISEIAFECGFKEASYFTKVYKQHYGSLPSKEE